MRPLFLVLLVYCMWNIPFFCKNECTNVLDRPDSVVTLI